MITILNTSILTNFGEYAYREVTLEEVRELVMLNYQSAIGHKSTADVISTLLDVECPVNRIEYKQGVGDLALIFKLKGRAEEGKILTREEIEEIGYTWGTLVRVA